MKFLNILLAALMFVQFAVADSLQRVPGHKFLVRDSGSTNKATLEVPSLSADYTMKLPSSMGSNGYVLKSNGSNATDWVNSLTNFSLTSPTIGDSITTTQISTPSTPSAGYNKIYTKSDNKLYVLDSSGVEKSAGGLSAWAASIPYAVGDIVHYSGNTYIAISAHTSGSTFESDVAAGGKWKLVNNPANGENLIKVGSNFEDNDIGAWTAVGCATVTTNFPACNGSGGAVFSAANGGRAKNAGTTDPAVTSSNPLNEVYSLNMATSGANAIGDMYVSPKINIPIKYQTKTLSFKFDYKVMSGTFVQAGNNTNTLGVAIYDVTNNLWTQPTGVFSIDGAGIATGTWQVPSNTTAAQLAVYYINAAGGATSVYLDDFYLGPQATSMGSPITNGQSYTPSLTGSTSNPNVGSTGVVSGIWRRVGDSMEINLRATTAGTGVSAGSGTYLFSIPSGYTIDVNKLANSAGSDDSLGSGWAYLGTSPAFYTLAVRPNSTTTVRFVNDGGVLASTFPSGGIAAAGQAITATFRVPIVGWSSSTIMSSDAATNVVAASYGNNSATTTIGTSATGLTYNLKEVDTLNKFDGTTYTVGVSGVYKIKHQVLANVTAWTSQGQIDAEIFVDAAQVSFGRSQMITATGFYSVSTEITKQLSAGQSITFAAQKQGGTFTANQHNDATASRISIERISGPSQISASETVAANRRHSSGQSIPNNVNTPVDFNVLGTDTHGSYQSGVTYNSGTGTWSTNPQWNIQTTGLYEISANLQSSSVAWTAGNLFIVGITKNGSAIAANYQVAPASGTYNLITAPAIWIGRLNAGDYIQVYNNQQRGSATNLSTDSNLNWVNIKRIGI